MRKEQLENCKEEFISKFTVWNSRYKYATLDGKEEYPTPDMIADWWINKIKIYDSKNI